MSIRIKPKSVGWAAIIILTPVVVFASNLTIPNTFTSGTPIQSAQVNTNFAAVQTAVNSKQDAITQSCAAGQAIVSITPTGTATCAQVTPKTIYTVWGRTTCAGSDAVVHTGYAGAFGGSQGAMSGTAMCIDSALAPTSWINWGAALVTRARSTTQTAGNRSEYMQSGDMLCAVCKGVIYTLWGRTTCGTGDTVVYTGHVAHITYNATNGGANNAGPFCVDDGATGITWTNWGGNELIARGAGAAGNPYVQYLDARDAPCVVCN